MAIETEDLRWKALLGTDGAWRLLAALPDPVFVIDAQGVLLFASPAAERVLGWNLSDWVGRQALEAVHPDDLEMALVSLESVQGKEVGSPIDVRIATAGGGWRYLEIVGTRLPSSGGTDPDDGDTIVLVARDMTERRRFEVSHDDLERFRALVQNSAAITMLVEADGTVASVSGAFARVLGHDPELAVGKSLLDWVVPLQRARVGAAFADALNTPGTSNFDATLVHRDGERSVPLELCVVNLLDDPVVEGLVITAYDVTPLREAQASLQHMATHDALTGLANRTLLLERAEDAVVRARDGVPVTVFFIDLDRFKPINDLRGHEAGDQLLQEFGTRLRALARGDDVVARIGGDEFVIVAEGIERLGDAQAVARRIETVLAEPVTLGAGPAQVFASVGFARSDADSTAESLIAEADSAMYLVKAARRGEVRTAIVRVAERRALADGLTTALNDDQLVAFYQPVIELVTGHISGFEALVRWQHPERGLLHPGDFMSVAEEAGLDGALGAIVLDQACRQLRKWHDTYDDQLTMAVNISSAQLADPELPAAIASAVKEYGLDPSTLCLEINEKSILEGPPRGTARPVAALLGALKEVGVRLAIDDFGTGYSSLTHIRRLPADVLKIDQSFVAGLGKDPGDTSVVQAVIGLAKAMGMMTIAEGVEEPEQARTLVTMGCRLAQGFLYSRAVPADEVGELFDRRRSPASDRVSVSPPPAQEAVAPEPVAPLTA